MNKRHYEHTLPNIRGSLSNTYVDRRERTTLYDVYQQGFSLLGLDCLKTRIPVRSNFTKDLSVTGGPVYRSTLFAPDAAFTKECGFNAFMDEIISILKTE